MTPSGTPHQPVTKLRIAMLENGCPQFLIAFCADFDNGTLSQYALGKKPIAPHHIIRLCTFLELRPEEIVGWMDADLDDEASIPDAVEIRTPTGKVPRKYRRRVA